MEDNWRRAIFSEGDDLGRVFDDLITTSVSLALMVAVILVFASLDARLAGRENHRQRPFGQSDQHAALQEDELSRPPSQQFQFRGTCRKSR